MLSSRAFHQFISMHFMIVCICMCVHVHVCRSMSCTALDGSPSYFFFGERVSSWARGSPIDLARLAGRCAEDLPVSVTPPPARLWLPLCCHAQLFPWVLRIWTQVFMLCRMYFTSWAVSLGYCMIFDYTQAFDGLFLLCTGSHSHGVMTTGICLCLCLICFVLFLLEGQLFQRMWSILFLQLFPSLPMCSESTLIMQNPHFSMEVGMYEILNSGINS